MSLPVILALAVQIPSVQTAIVHSFTEIISERLDEQASVSVGRVYYSFFNRLIVDDIFVSDIKGDTLLFVHQAAVSLSGANIHRKKVHFNSVKLYSGILNLYNTSASMNIKDVLAPLSRRADTMQNQEKKPWDIHVKALGLDNFRFTFVNNRKPAPDKDSVINFKNLNVRNIHINIDHIRFAHDTLLFRINRLQFEEKSGYRLKQLRTDASICGTQTMLRNLVLIDNYSKLSLKHYAMNYESSADLSDYEEKVHMEADFKDAFLSSKTLGYFARGLKKPDINIRLNGFASGSVDNLRSDSLLLASESGETHLLFKFRMRGLPEIEETMITMDIMDLTTHMADLSKVLKGIVPNISDSVFSFIAPFEQVYLTGNFTGLYNDFVSNARLSSAIGDVALDMQMNVAEVQKEGLSYRGRIDTKNFLWGTLIKNNNLFGELSIQAEAKGFILPPEKGGFKVDANAYVSEMKFHKYYYHNISLNGKYADHVFAGNVVCDDPNLQFTFKGEAGTNPEKADSSYRYHFDFLADIKHANLVELNLNHRDTLSIASGKIEIDYYMRNLLDGQGHILVSGVDYAGPLGALHYDTCRLDAVREDSLYKIRLRSEIADADYMGSDNLEYFFNYLLKDTYKRHTSKNKPVKSTGRASRKYDYLFNARFKTTQGLTNALFPGVTIADNSELSMVLDTDDSLQLNLKSNFLAYENNVLTNVDVFAGSNTEKLNVNIAMDEVDLFGLNLLNAHIIMDAKDALMDTKMLFDNRKTSGANKGSIETMTHFSDDSVVLQILSSTLVLNDSTWKFDDSSEIVFKDSLIRFNHLRAYNQSQELKLNGTVSHHPSDVLRINLNNFELATFDAFLKNTSYSLKGKMSGQAQAMDVYNTPIFSADLLLTNIHVNNHPFGSVELSSRWNNEQKQLLLDAKLQNNEEQLLTASGYYMPTVRYLDLSTSFHQFRVHHVEPLLDGIMHDIDGYLSGTIGLSGPMKSLTLKGNNVQLSNAALTVDFLNTRYRFSTPVDITPSKIILRNVEISDEHSGKGIFSATFSHHHFSNFNLDLSLYPQNMLVLNTTEQNNKSFYGTAYASGVATIKGPPSNLVFDITARTERNTVFAIPINSEQQAKEMSILTFVQPPVKEQAKSDVYKQTLKTVKKPSDMIINMNIEATPDAQVQIVFDQRSGDAIKAFGSGNIKLDLRPAQDVFNILGDYMIERGDYLFTLQDMRLANKKFYLEQGGRVMFNGDVMRTTLDLSALYKAKASLNTLIYDTSSVANRRPVDCMINITGTLLNPTLNFKVDVQNVDPETRARVQAALNTEEKMIRQFLSLLAFGNFLPDQQSGVTANINLTGTATEMLSNQFSNMLNQLGISWDVGFIYTPSQNGNDVIDIAISKQFFNNRLLINGNIGNTENTSSSGFTGDFDMEYKIDRKDRFRVKLFTHSVDQFSDNFYNGQRSGVGFSYQEEFNNFKELFQSFFRKKKTIEEQPPAKKEDEESRESTTPSLLEFKQEE